MADTPPGGEPDINKILAGVGADLIKYYISGAVDAVKRALSRLHQSRETDRRNELAAGLIHYQKHAFQAAVPLLRASITGMAAGPDRLAANLFLSHCLFMSGRVVDAARLARVVAQDAEKRGERPIQFEALLLVATANTSLHRFDASETACTQARHIAITEGQDSFLLRVKHQVGLISRWRGDYKQAEELLGEVLSAAEALDDLALEATVLDNLGIMFWEQREFSKAVEYFSRSVDIERSRRFLPGLADALCNLGRTYLAMGQWDDAERAFKEALELDEAMGSELGEAVVLSNLGELYIATGAYDEAKIRLEQALAVSRDAKMLHAEAIVTRSLGRLSEERGEDREAIKYYDKATRIAMGIDDRRTEMGSRALLGQAQARMGETVDAWDSFERCRALAEEVGDWMGHAQSLHCLGRISAQGGNLDQAKDLMEEAIRIYEGHGSNAESSRVMQELTLITDLGDSE